MPKKASPETEKEQSERFKKDAQKLIDAGELSPIEAAEAIDKLIKSSILHPKGGTRLSTKS